VNQRELVDAAITGAIRARYAANPTRAEYAVKRYLDFMAAYREKLASERDLSEPNRKRLQHMTRRTPAWSAAYAKRKLKEANR
jgi:hypothetical protein